MQLLDEVRDPPPERGPFRLKSPLAVSGVALLGYLLICYLFLGRGGDLRDFVQVGTKFVEASHTSQVIQIDPSYKGYPENGIGYDGQFAYYIAIDPVNARHYVGRTSYRYTRILYPALAWALSLGIPGWVPATLILVNLLAVVGGTWAVAAWCRERGLSPWLALVYAFYVGQVMAFTRDLTEVLAYALVALGVYLYDRSRLLAAILFGLAVLARETTVIFPALYILFLLLGGGAGATRARRLSEAGVLAAISVGPAVLWQLFLLWWLGEFGWQRAIGPVWLPFSGLVEFYPFSQERLEVIQAVVVPGVVSLTTGIWAMWRQAAWRRVEVWALVLNALLFVVLLPSASLSNLLGSARAAIVIVLAAIYVLPYVRGRGWFYFCAALWLIPTLTYLLNPLIDALRQ